MSPRTKTQLDALKGEKRRLILDAAMKEIAEKGFTSTSVSSIAIRAGISKGLIYNYFESKDQLAKEILLEGIYKAMNFYNFTSEVVTDEVFKGIITKTFDLLDQEPEFWKIYFSFSFQPAVLQILVTEIPEMMQGFIAGFVEYFRSKNHPDFINEAYFIGAVFDGLSLNYLYNKENFSKEYAIKRILQILDL